MRTSLPLHYGMAQETYEQVARQMAIEIHSGGTDPSVIRQNCGGYLELLVIDLHEYGKRHCMVDARCNEGFLMVASSTTNGITYASVDHHYVRKSSALARFRALK